VEIASVVEILFNLLGRMVSGIPIVVFGWSAKILVYPIPELAIYLVFGNIIKPCRESGWETDLMGFLCDVWSDVRLFKLDLLSFDDHLVLVKEVLALWHMPLNAAR
jgi:hypothetical protein